MLNDCVTYIRFHIDIGPEFEQVPNHVDLTEVTSDMQTCVATLEKAQQSVSILVQGNRVRFASEWTFMPIIDHHVPILYAWLMRTDWLFSWTGADPVQLIIDQSLSPPVRSFQCPRVPEQSDEIIFSLSVIRQCIQC